MNSYLKAYAPVLVLFNVIILLILTNSSSVPPFVPSVYAHDSIETLCRDRVSKSIAREKAQADRYRDIQLAGVGILGGVGTASATLTSGPIGASVGSAITGTAVLAILGAHNRTILALEEQEDAELEQCALDAQYLREEADAAEQGEEGTQSSNTVQFFGFGFGTGDGPVGETGGDFL